MTFLGIEIGGTKLAAWRGLGGRREARRHGADGGPPGSRREAIRRQIVELARPLVARHQVQAIGIGFGGPVDMAAGRVVKSHHVAGWEAFPLAAWCRETFGISASLGNDSDLAGLGEARFGAGRGRRVVFYTNVGSGIGGALVVNQRVYVGCAGIASEIGHLRPGPQAVAPDEIVELVSSGWAIAAAARAEPALAPRSSGNTPARPSS